MQAKSDDIANSMPSGRSEAGEFSKIRSVTAENYLKNHL
jgi:hypothetical protein